MELQSLFYPNAVAVFGSASEGKLANVLINRLLDGGMKEVYAVNPKANSVRTAKGYSSILEIGKPIDMAVIASPASTVKGIVDDCGKCGVKSCIIISSGFSEVGNAEGEKEVIETAKHYGIRFIGPNCAGMICTQGNLVATLETSPPTGNISIISQSGAAGGSFMALSAQFGVGISKFISYGNGGDLTVLELLRYLKDDADTKVIALYLETIPTGRQFMESVNEVCASKPVVIVKAGRSKSGQRAALSHTGSMAGADTVCDAALRQCGAIRVDTLMDLFEVCKGFATMPPVKGLDLAIVTNSGGPGVMTVDKAEEKGLLIPETSEAVKEQLREYLPSFAGLRNPIDLTVEATGEHYRRAIEIALTEHDSAIALYIGTPYLKAMPYAKAIVEAARNTNKPLAAVMQVGSDIEESIEYLRNEGIATFASGEDAARVISTMAYYEIRRTTENVGSCLAEVKPIGKAFGDCGRLLEPEAMTLLRDNGIPVPNFAFVQSEDEAAAEAAKIGYPVVVKVVSPQIIHKSDCGGVKLGIKNDAEVREAFRHMQTIAEDKDFRGVIIYPMLQKGKEVIVGLTKDPTFGSLVAFGMGGIYTEVLKDVTFRVAPVDILEAKKMIGEIKMAALLRGVRGEAPSDIDAMATLISRFSMLPFLYPDIHEADLNPVFVYDTGVCTADCRILGK